MKLKAKIHGLAVGLALALAGGLMAPAFGQQRLCYTTDGTNCIPAVQAGSSVAISTSAAATTQLVALAANKRIYVTAWDVVSAGTTTVTLKYGTGSNCGTGTTSLTGGYSLTAQAGLAKGNGLGPVLVVPPGNALCVTNSAAVAIAGSVAYVQF